MPFLLDSDGRRKLCVFADTDPGSSRSTRMSWGQGATRS
jgi:hypothetical protein